MIGDEVIESNSCLPTHHLALLTESEQRYFDAFLSSHLLSEETGFCPEVEMLNDTAIDTATANKATTSKNNATNNAVPSLLTPAQKRLHHLQAEQERRRAIRHGFKRLAHILGYDNETSSDRDEKSGGNRAGPSGSSKASILEKACGLIDELDERIRWLESLKSSS